MKRASPAFRIGFVEPMKALGAEMVPSSDAGEWVGEVKYDGYRALAVIRGKKTELWSRNHKPLDYPELLPALAKLPCAEAVLDGEIVAFDEQGHSDFQLLQGRDLGERPPIVYYIFDLLAIDGRSYLDVPLGERRRALEKLLKRAASPVQLSPVFHVAPADLLAETKRLGLEGVILKRSGSAYEPGRRSGAWLKVKNMNEQEFVIAGFTPPKNSRQNFGAILVGYYQDKKLRYAGKVGTGFDARKLADLHAHFLERVIPACPFSNLPLGRRSRFGEGMTAGVMRSVTWLRPQLVAQIRFAEWTQDGLLRQPVFLGLRSDKAAGAVVREVAGVKTQTSPPRRRPSAARSPR